MTEVDSSITQEEFPDIPEGCMVCSCLNCKWVLRVRMWMVSGSVVPCACGAEINIPPKQFAHGSVDQAGERLWADDESAKERVLAIDLSIYDKLVTYPVGVDWPLERKKIFFLQTALRIGIPWTDVVQLTRPYFGRTLSSPPVPLVALIHPSPFTPPAFDIARQTLEGWAEAAEEAWIAYRSGVIDELREYRKQSIETGLKEFERPRRSSGMAEQKKAPIASERDEFIWAVLFFFSTQYGCALSWAEIAKHDPAPGAPTHPAPKAATAKRRRAEQIRTRATKVLRDLGLPLPK